MAGIGFSLQRLYAKDSLIGQTFWLGHAAAVAAGPWLFTIFSLGIISLSAEQIAGIETLAEFRVAVIYAFALSLIACAPVVIVATRLVADALYARKFERVSTYFIGAVCAGVVVSLALVGWLYFVRIRVAVDFALAAGACCMMVGLIWIVLAFAGTVKDYRGVTLAFVFGLLIGVAAAVWAAVMGFGPVGMVIGFTAGLTVTFAWLAHRVLATFPQPVRNPLDGLREIVRAIGRYRLLAIGACAGAAGIWVDKWILWSSPIGEQVGAGLVHAPLYDSAMFIAYLAIIPSLATFVGNLETRFFTNFHQYYSTILNQGSLRRIEEIRRHLSRDTLGSLYHSFLIQFGICAIVILMAPLIVEMLNLQYRQIPILRMGAMGAAFQFIFLASTSILLFFDRGRAYLALQLLFLSLNGGLTYVSVEMGSDYYGFGYFLAAVISGVVAFKVMEATLDRLNFLTFVESNA